MTFFTGPRPSQEELRKWLREHPAVVTPSVTLYVHETQASRSENVDGVRVFASPLVPRGVAYVRDPGNCDTGLGFTEMKSP